MMRKGLSVSLLPALVALAISTSVSAQIVPGSSRMVGPDYGSGNSTGTLSNPGFNTPEADGRPGVKYYKQGMAAYHHGDTGHAIYMLKLAAYWAYAPAAYNLGVMYFQGEGGVRINRPLGTAWMFIAAERGAPDYVSARHMLVAKLDYGERTKALALLQQLQPKYGEKATMPRAKGQWAIAKSHETGTRVGGTVGELHVGATNRPSHNGGVATFLRSGYGFLPSGSLDGSMAYRQFQRSDDPYDPVFLKYHTGTVSVEPLQPVEPATDKTKKQGNGADGAAQPTQPRRGA